MNITDITNMSDTELDNLLGVVEDDTFRCPGCGETLKKHENYHPGDCCDGCFNWSEKQNWGLYDDSWGDHNPNYDY